MAGTGDEEQGEVCDRVPTRRFLSASVKALGDLGGSHFRPHLIDEDTELRDSRVCPRDSAVRGMTGVPSRPRSEGSDSPRQNPPGTPPNGGASQ